MASDSRTDAGSLLPRPLRYLSRPETDSVQHINPNQCQHATASVNRDDANPEIGIRKPILSGIAGQILNDEVIADRCRPPLRRIDATSTFEAFTRRTEEVVKHSERSSSKSLAVERCHSLMPLDREPDLLDAHITGDAEDE